MSDTKVTLADIKKTIDEKDKNLHVQTDAVVIAGMQADALKKLAEIQNEIFSRIPEHEVFDMVRLLSYADNPCPSVNDRLIELSVCCPSIQPDKKKQPIAIPLYENVVRNILKYRHAIKGKRIEEYLQGLRAIGRTEMSLQPEKPGIFKGRQWI